MIKDPKFFEEWERKFIASEPPNYKRNVRIFEAMLSEVKALGVWPPKDPLEGIEVDLRVARMLNASRST